jgi:hypothetical protein
MKFSVCLLMHKFLKPEEGTAGKVPRTINVARCGGEWLASCFDRLIPPVPIGQESRWASKPFWTQWT